MKSSYYDYPRAILHIDGDSFFASCEVAKNPALKGKVVITGKERGIASAMTYEAKRKGITRGMRIFEILKICPEAIILPSDYETYSLYSERMYNIVRRYTPEVDEYSIDECFADITGLRSSFHLSYEEIAKNIKHDLDTELGMTFSVGLAPTKVLAKVASKWAKPSGLTFIPFNKINEFLIKLKIDKVWGIGSQTTALLNKYRIFTAYDFICKNQLWVTEHLAKPYLEIWQELKGIVVYKINLEQEHIYKSISKTKTFTPPSKDKLYIFSQLSKNIENACIKARRNGLVTPVIKFFLKTQTFEYHGMEVKLSQNTSIPGEIIKVLEKYFDQVYQSDVLYRATGITLEKLNEDKKVQMDLFGENLKAEKTKIIYDFVDSLSIKFGKHAVFLGSSFRAMVKPSHLGDRSIKAKRTDDLFKGETKRKRLKIPMLGEAS
jgi:DNA polymerase-4